MSILEHYGVQPVINAAGTVTRLGGALVRPEVSAAMVEVAGCSVDIEALQAQASKTIAALTGAESGYVTSGASAGLLLATSACLAGLDPSRMASLPNGVDSRNEVLVARSQRNSYDHAV
ncbi:MAG: aminotransferase class V-fold PLP-dependent enzyme, partial [Alphaproteobacteria bacterium]